MRVEFYGCLTGECNVLLVGIDPYQLSRDKKVQDLRRCND